MTCGQVWWPIHGICALSLTHPSAHTLQWEVNKHTHHEHTPGAVGSHLCCGAWGAVGGSVPCSRVSPQSWYWGCRECCTFTPPTYNSCRTWDSNPRPLGYKSDSLFIRPRLPIFTYSPQVLNCTPSEKSFRAHKFFCIFELWMSAFNQRSINCR